MKKVSWFFSLVVFFFLVSNIFTQSDSIAQYIFYDSPEDIRSNDLDDALLGDAYINADY